MADPATCPHRSVEYRPVDHGNGKHTDRWQCTECPMEFWPMEWQTLPPALQIYGSGSAPANEKKEQ
ncbi:MAG TPA: hypothetical protein VMJ35_07820 [Dongiaceae bacterium]|nr:hypothetical protein [Dongiaceae bacterium]